jgi:hypothetical protein
MTAEERVAAGAELLDRTIAHERNWRAEIDTDALQMQHSCLCIFGQLYGRYYLGRWHLTEAYPGAFPHVTDEAGWHDLGFVESPYLSNYTVVSDAELQNRYQLLNDAWRSFLAAA